MRYVNNVKVTEELFGESHFGRAYPCSLCSRPLSSRKGTVVHFLRNAAERHRVCSYQ